LTLIGVRPTNEQQASVAAQIPLAQKSVATKSVTVARRKWAIDAIPDASIFSRASLSFFWQYFLMVLKHLNEIDLCSFSKFLIQVPF
jgi:hypothetical protein